MGWSKYEATLPDHGMHTMQYYSERSEVYTRARSSSVWLLCELLKHRSRLPHRVEFHRRLQGCQTKWATFTKRGGSYKSTLVLDSMTHQVKPCVTLNCRLSWRTSMLVSFLRQQTSNSVCCLLDLSRWPHRYRIPEFSSPIELFFVTSKIFASSWHEPAWSFAFASGSKSCGLYTS